MRSRYPAARVDGFEFGIIASYEDFGDARVTAPDGSIAILRWKTGSPASFAPSIAPSERSWGTYAVQLPLPLTTDDEAAQFLAAFVPDLRRQWEGWVEERRIAAEVGDAPMTPRVAIALSACLVSMLPIWSLVTWFAGPAIAVGVPVGGLLVGLSLSLWRPIKYAEDSFRSRASWPIAALVVLVSLRLVSNQWPEASIALGAVVGVLAGYWPLPTIRQAYRLQRRYAEVVGALRSRENPVVPE